MRFSIRAAGFLLVASAALPFIAENAAASPTPRMNHTATVMSNGNILICGGENPTGTFLNSCEIFIATGGFYTGTFPFGAGAGTARSSHTATALPNGKVLFAGGNNVVGTALKLAEIFNPATGGWTDVTNAGTGFGTAAGRTDHSATLISNSHTANDGKVLIVGGRNNAGTLPTTLLYDPAANTWAAGPAMNCDRAHHTATSVYSGKVFVAGGFSTANCISPSGAPSFIPYTETYDPSIGATGGWTTSAPMISSRAYHTATVLGNTSAAGGTPLNEFVLLAGGYNGINYDGTNGANRRNYGFMNSSEIYNPIGNSMQLGPNMNESVSGAAASETPDSVASLFDGFGTLDFITYNNKSSSVDQTPPNMPSFVFVESTGQPAGIASTDVYKGHPITSGNLNLLNVSIDFGNTDLAGYIVNGVLDVSSASVAVTSGTLYFTTIHPELDPILTANCGNANQYCPGLRASLNGLTMVSGKITVPSLQFSITAPRTGFAGYKADSCPTNPPNNDAYLNTYCNDRVVATSTTPMFDTSNAPPGQPNPNELANEIQTKSLTIVTASVTIAAMVFQSEANFNPNNNPASWAFALGKSGNIPPLKNLTFTLLPNGDSLAYGGLNVSMNAPNGLVNSSATFTLTSNRPWNSQTNLQIARANHTVTMLPTGNVLIAGGTNGPPTVLNSAELFDPVANKTSFTTPMNVARDKHTATLLPNGRVLVAGGFAQTATSTGVTTSCEFYDPQSGLWYPTGSLNAARQNHTATLLANGNVLVAGGDQASGPILNSAEVYVTTAGTWMPIASMADARTLHAANLMQDGTVLVTGGLGSTVLGKTAILNPTTYGWSAGTSMNTARYGHTATTLRGNTVMVAGGNSGSGDISSIEIFTPNGQALPVPTNPAACNPAGGPNVCPLSAGICGAGGGCWNAFSAAKAYSSYYHTATQTPSGKVYMAGGESILYPNSLTGTDLFDLEASTVTQQGTLNNARQYHAAALLPTGNVAVFGGVKGGGSYLNSIEVSNPLPGGPDGRQPVVNSLVPSHVDQGASFTINGSQFLGLNAEASGGGAGGSAFNLPRLLLQRLESSGGTGPQQSDGYLLDLSTLIYNSGNQWTNIGSSITVALPAGPLMPYGWYHVRVMTDAEWSTGQVLQVAPPAPAGTPGGLAATAISSTSITWTWNQGTLTPGNFSGYEVYQATSFPQIFLSTVPASNPVFVQAGLTGNTTASILVAGYTLGGIGMVSTSPVTFTLAAPPGIPVLSSVTQNSASITWSPNGNSTSTIYEVSYSSDAPPLQPFTGDIEVAYPYGQSLMANTAVVSNLNTNATYSFRVRSFNGNAVPSTFSVVVTTITPSALPGVSGTALSTSSILWSWLPTAGATQYNVYNATTPAPLLIASTGAATFIDTGLGVNSLRQITVGVVTAAGLGPLTLAQPVFTLANTPVFASPGLVNPSTGGLSGFWFDGGNPPGTTYNYTVTRTSDGLVMANALTTIRSFSLPNLSPNTLYTASVTAQNGSGIATAALVLGSTFTLASPPASLQVLGTSPAGITISWDSNGNPPGTLFRVTVSSNNFLTSISTPIPFSANYTNTQATISGLLTATTYTLQVAAANGYGQPTAAAIVSTLTFNGGGPAGSIAAVISPAAAVTLTGTLGSGRAVSVTFPQNAFPGALTVFVSSRTNIAACGGINAAISITPVPAMQPTVPFTLQLSYSPAELGAANVTQLSIVRYDPVSNQCIPLQTTVDSANRVLTAQVNHLSDFQIMAIVPPTTLAGARVFPNPLDRSVQGFMTFDRMPVNSRVRIYTLHGEEVWDSVGNASGILQWPAVNKTLRPIASGIYIAVIDGGGQRQIMKLAVIR